MIKCVYLSLLVVCTRAGPVTESYKDQFCTDPRTMSKHGAYTEWADAYSCSRHRCQPGGRNLAIYTVGCKRVEAPESAIECEEVVEDTNMQFPYCCTRLRCLVVVRGEVWTRVLGQPWEALPAAPWSHMYKMKKPPPTDDHFGPKSTGVGPVYELQAEPERESAMRASKKAGAPDCSEPVHRAAPAPDIVIALATSNDDKELKKNENARHKRVKKPISRAESFPDEENKERNEVDFEEIPINDKVSQASDEKLNDGVKQSESTKSTWTDIPQNQWNEHDPSMDVEQRSPADKSKSGLQALVDAIGSRMRDIESVVQRMSDAQRSGETRSDKETKHHKADKEDNKDDIGSPKKPSPDSEHYKRFSVKNRSKYLQAAGASEQPLFVEDTHMNGYFSDASNSVRRSNTPKEQAPTYMAPVENRRKSHAPDISNEGEKQHKKHSHKKKKKSKGHKKHHSKDDKRKHFNKITSIELDKAVVSLEDSNAL